MLIYKTEAEYEAAMDEIYDLMNRGTSLTEAEKDKLREMAVAAEKYEDIHFPFPPPPTSDYRPAAKRPPVYRNRTTIYTKAPEEPPTGKSLT